MSHWYKCAAPPCRTLIEPPKLTCGFHWRALPQEMRRSIARTRAMYGDNSTAHRTAVDKAIAWLNDNVPAKGDRR